MSLILGIDTSCDETSIAVLKNGSEILSNIISSQISIHKQHGGVVPEIASRTHLTNLPTVLADALQKANIELKDLTGIAVTAAPGLIGCLLTGLSFAKSLAYSLKIPLTTVHHLKAHLMSPWIEVGQEVQYPFLGLVVSGGHTALYHVRSFDEIDCVGQTVDDAAGEAYDKISKLMGLGYPGGPIIDKLAREGNPNAFSFTRAKVKRGKFFLSFSGLKTAVFQKIKEQTEISENFKKDLAASFQAEVVGALIEKVEMVLDEFNLSTVAVSGGVAVNSRLRSELKLLSSKRNVTCLMPSPILCTDNGGMIAFVGARQLTMNQYAGLSVNAFASGDLHAFAEQK